MVQQKHASVDAYLATLPPDVRDELEAVRRTVRDALPDSGETISYHMPLVTFEGEGLFFLAGWKKHLSVYPVPELDETTAAEAAPYLSGASTLKFPLAKPIPHDLIRRVALLHAAQRRAGASE